MGPIFAFVAEFKQGFCWTMTKLTPRDSAPLMFQHIETPNWWCVYFATTQDIISADFWHSVHNYYKDCLFFPSENEKPGSGFFLMVCLQTDKLNWAESEKFHYPSLHLQINAALVICFYHGTLKTDSFSPQIVTVDLNQKKSLNISLYLFIDMLKSWQFLLFFTWQTTSC